MLAISHDLRRMRLTIDQRDRRDTTKRRTPQINVKPVARTYFRSLMDLVRMLFADIKESIGGQLQNWVAEEQLTQDQADEELDLTITRLKQKYTTPSFLLQYNTTARTTADQTSTVQGVQNRAQLKSLGLNIFRETPAINRLLRRFTVRNTRLITSIPQQSLDRVAQVVGAGIAAGDRASTISAQIAKEFGVTRRRAMTIARDQTNKFAGDLSRSRNRANGIDRFIWRTAGDERVRDLHDNREGKTYDLATGAGATDPFPGDGVQCRCWQEPIL